MYNERAKGRVCPQAPLGITFLAGVYEATVNCNDLWSCDVEHQISKVTCCEPVLVTTLDNVVTFRLQIITSMRST